MRGAYLKCKLPTVTIMQEQLREALTAFLSASATRDAGKIRAALARIGELRRQLGDDAPAELRHYLERRSYQKALEFLKSGA